MKKTVLVLLSLFVAAIAFAQPEPCGPIPMMANVCEDACVICDIDGYTGTNDLGNNGTAPPGFCSTPNDMHWIAFIAGSTSLSIRIDVSNCTNVGAWQSLDLGFYASFDCENFTQITECREDLEGGDFHIFNTIVPLTIGQHYYLVMDGSNGSVCDWTFTVLDGSTLVSPLDASGEIILPEETCPNFLTTIMNTGQLGAALYYWTVEGVDVPNFGQQFQYSFPTEGTYEICCRAANACDDGPQICKSINVREVGTLEIEEILCDGECLEFNGNQYCFTGTFQEIITLPNGCDSTINIQIEVLPQPISNPDVWICNDDFFFIGTTGYNQTGSYTGTVLTQNDCDSIVNLELLVIECEIIGTPDEIPVICNGTATGILVFSVDQGEPPLTFTYTNIFDPSITGTGMTNLLINNEIPNIPAGEYNIYIQDNFGNDVVVTQIVTEPPVLEIELIPSDYNGFNVSCFSYLNTVDTTIIVGDDGTLMANVFGGVPPYSYLWSDGQMDQQAISLTYQNYEVVVTDNVGCSITANFTLDSPPLLNPSVLFNDPTCDGFDTGEIVVADVTGGVSTYQYSLNDFTTFSNDSLYSSLFEGDYTVYVQDNNGCINLVNGTITAPDIPVITFTEDLEIDLGDTIQIIPGLNDTSIGEINWADLSTTLSCDDCLEPISYAVNNSEYVLTITSEDGCSDTDSISVSVNKVRPVYIPNIFSPDGNGTNENFMIFTNRATEIVEELLIYDRWGNLIFEQKDFPSNDEDYGWDGRFNNKIVNNGVFVYYTKIKFIDNVSLPYSGSFTLIR